MLEERIEFCKKLVVQEAVVYLQPILGKPTDEILREFLRSKTYALVQDTETRMWAEAGEYVGDWYLEEIRGTGATPGL